MSARAFIVVFDDEMGTSWPMGWDSECAGAIEATGCAVALFDSRAEARKAIRISTAYAKLCAAQGQPANEDFLANSKFVKIVPCVAQER